jgi:hypothetical protein
VVVRLRLFWTVAPLAGMVMAVPACGSASGTPRDTVTASSVRASPQKEATPAMSTSPSSPPLGGSDHSARAEPGKVTITVSASSYRGGSPVSAVITNGLNQAIYTEDGKSDCSIAFLERRDGASWTEAVGCGLRRPPATVAIGAGRGRTVGYDPAGISARSGGGTTSTLAAGTYRIRFTYRLTGEPAAEDPLGVLSASFTIT